MVRRPRLIVSTPLRTHQRKTPFPRGILRLMSPACYNREMAPRKKTTKRKRTEQSSAARDLMLNKPPKTARQVVFRVLEHWQTTGEFFGETLQTLSLKADLKVLDRTLAREMVAGVIRRQGTLDALIKAHIKRPRENVEDPLWWLLWMGTYELAFLTGIPPHASVNETTELARYLRRPQWTGFLNGTLRSISRGLLDDQINMPAADSFPLADGRYRKCAGAWFPDPKSDPIGYFSTAFSFPQWLSERWQNLLSIRSANALSPLPLGERARVRGLDDQHATIQGIAGQASSGTQSTILRGLEELGFWFNSPPPLMLRVNPLRTTRHDVLESFAKENIKAEAGELDEAIVLNESRNVTELPGFAGGLFSVQDLTAMKAVALLRP